MGRVRISAIPPGRVGSGVESGLALRAARLESVTSVYAGDIDAWSGLSDALLARGVTVLYAYVALVLNTQCKRLFGSFCETMADRAGPAWKKDDRAIGRFLLGPTMSDEFIDLNNNILSASIGVFTLPSEIDPYNFRDLLILYAIPAGVLRTQNRRLLRR